MDEKKSLVQTFTKNITTFLISRGHLLAIAVNIVCRKKIGDRKQDCESQKIEPAK